MNSGKYVFYQITEFINRYEFNKCVKCYNGNLGVRDLDCWNQFLQLLFGQLSSLNSLRNICICLKQHSKKLYHLGIKQYVNVSTLSRANEKRDWRIFALDSTTISVIINLLSWALGKYSRGAIKIHTLMDLRGDIPTFIHITDGRYHDSNILDEIISVPNAIYLMDKAYIDLAALYKLNSSGSFFITRAKKNMKYDVIEQNFNIDETTGLLFDKEICLKGHKSIKLYPENLRLVGLYDSDKSEIIGFLTNNFEISAFEVAILYRNRWKIEFFFKFIKQNLSIKKLWGHSENAVKIHIWVAIITYLLIAYVKKILKSPLSIYEMIELLGISLFDKTPIQELISDTEIELDMYQQLKLFDF